MQSMGELTHLSRYPTTTLLSGFVCPKTGRVKQKISMHYVFENRVSQIKKALQ
jgi:hypothetical protein